MRTNMKDVTITILSFVLTGAILTGCGESRHPRQDIPQSSILQETVQDTVVETPETETKTETKAAQTKDYEDNFAVDNQAAKEFAEKIKNAAAEKDLEALAELTVFPVYVGLPDVGVVATKEDFLKLGAETVFTEGLLQSVEHSDIEHLQPSMAGFSVSDGGTANINFGVSDGELGINGINY